MRKTMSMWLLLSLLLILQVIALQETQAQPQPTTAEGFQIRNQAGEEVSLTVPSSGVSPYSVLFPTTAPGTGDLFFSSNSSGQMSWLTPGPDGSVLVVSTGLPQWQNPTDLFWGVAGNSGTNPATNFLGTLDAEPLVLRTNNTERMRLTADGRIGIGIPAPLQTVDVSSNNASGVMRIANVSNGPALILASTGSSNTLSVASDAFVVRSGGSVLMNGTQLVFDFQGSSNNSRFTLRNASVNGSQAFFSVQDSGLVVSRNRRVGIGVPVPLASLHIVSPSLDPLRVEGLTTNNAAANVLVSNASGITYTRSASNIIDSTAWSLSGNTGTNPATNFLGTLDAQPLVLRTDNAERMRISSTGDVSIGTSVTPSGTRLNVSGGNIAVDATSGRKIGFGGEHGMIYRDQSGHKLYISSQTNLHFIADANNNTSDIPVNLGDNTFVWGINKPDIDSAAYRELARMNALGFLGFDVDGLAPPTRIYAKNDNQSEQHDDITLQTFSNTYTPSTVLQRALGTEAASANLAAGDVIGVHTFSAFLTGAAFSPGAAIRAVADVNHTTTNVGSRLEFMTANNTTLATAMSIDRLGQVGIGTTIPAQTLHVVGNAGKTVGGTTWVVISDERTKNIDGDYQKGLDAILALRPVMFKYKEDNPWNAPSDIQQYGFIAQEVQPIFPEAIEEQKDGYLTFNMHPLLVAYTNAIKGLNGKIEVLKQENMDLRTELKSTRDNTAESIEQLQARIEQLERILPQTSEKSSKNRESVE